MSAPRLVIEQIRPSVDGGRQAVKRLLGDTLAVEATAYRDGHELVAGRVRFRGPGDRRWRTAAMRYDINFDRLRGEIALDRIGTWVYCVEAWTDRFASWRADFAKRVAGGVDASEELREGAALVTEAARHARGQPGRTLRARAHQLGTAAPAQAVAIAQDEALVELVARHLPTIDLTAHPTAHRVVVDRRIAGFAAWYEMFPRSQGEEPGRHATFADAARRLPRLAELGFDVVYLPPIHPVGRSHRKGPNNTLTAGPDDPGSPWAIGNELGGHTAVEPALGTLADFRRFVAAAEAVGMEVALDYALQCSPDHPWVREHPDWFFVRPDGTIRYAENPPKKYEDIYPLNFWCADHPALWAACRDIFLFWIEQGVRIFRVDNPHTKPFAFWEWLIGELKRDYPDVILLSEAFTRPARMKGLAKLGFSQSYTYFTWRNAAHELREYLTELATTDMVEYFRPNLFTNTPDILHEYLQRGGRPAFRVRLTLAATLAPLYGIYSGFELCENVPVRAGSEEYLHSEKYEIRVRDWEAPGNLNADIARLNRLRREHPALQRLDNLRFHHAESEHILFYHKHAPGDDLLIAVNLDPRRPQETMVHVPLDGLGLTPDQPFDVQDLLTGARYTWRGARNFVRLDPQREVAHVLHVIGPRAG
jgi:starch synthase (maltosyl-transferring)